MLLVVFGPPAVGKMTVGRRVADRTGFRLFHNHMTIEPLLEVFDFGTPPYNVLNGEFRRRVMEEAARHGVDLVFTFVWALDHPGDSELVESYVRLFDGPPSSSSGRTWRPGSPGTAPRSGSCTSPPSATSTGRTPTCGRWSGSG